MQAERIPPAISGAVASYGTNWFDPGETEYEAWQQISGLTLPDGVLYVAVPWTWMIEAIRNGRAAELQGALAAFAQGLPPADHVLTVCAHPELGQHWPLLRRCGITEVFWPHLALPPAELAGAAVVHPQPLTTAVPLVAPGSAGFADCTGPLAAPRIWAALGKGEVPVFRIEDLALPGDARLWLRACVPCDVNTAMGAPLQDYLATLAADAGAMAQKRDHLAELTLEYLGPGLIQQVHRRLLQLAAEAGNAVAELKSPVLAQLDRALRPKLAAGLPLTPDEAQRVLLAAGSAVMLGGAAAHRRLMRPGTLARLREAAEAALPEADEARRHLDRVLMVERLRGDVPAPALVTTPAPLRVCLFGFHSNRTPLSYAPLRAQLTGRIAFCDSAETADLVVAGFNIDYARNLAWVQDWAERRPALKFAVLSEEPLWDTTWSDGFTEPQRRLPGAAGTAGGIDYAVLNHVTTAIFDFHRLPYFVLTDNRYVSRLRACTARWGALSAEALLARWQAARWQAAFVAEHRSGPEFTGGWPELGILRLSAFRTELAAAVAGPALQMGKGWTNSPARQDLVDWHLDKLARINGQTRLLSAIENTHLASYITEKPFDAFASGALPICLAGPGHRLFELIPEAAMLNLWGLDPAAAARAVDGFQPTPGHAAAWIDTCRALAGVLGDVALVQAERRRVMEAVVDSLRLVQDGGFLPG